MFSTSEILGIFNITILLEISKGDILISDIVPRNKELGSCINCRKEIKTGNDRNGCTCLESSEIYGKYTPNNY